MATTSATQRFVASLRPISPPNNKPTPAFVAGARRKCSVLFAYTTVERIWISMSVRRESNDVDSLLLWARSTRLRPTLATMVKPIFLNCLVARNNQITRAGPALRERRPSRSKRMDMNLTCGLPKMRECADTMQAAERMIQLDQPARLDAMYGLATHLGNINFPDVARKLCVGSISMSLARVSSHPNLTIETKLYSRCNSSSSSILKVRREKAALSRHI